MPEWRLGRHRGKFCAVRGSGAARRRHPLSEDREEAERFLHRLNNPRPRSPTVKWLWDAYCQEKKGRAVIATMEHTWKALGPHFGHHDAEAVTVDQCNAYTADRRARGRADGTIHTELGHLRTVLVWGQRRRLIAHAPHIERPPKPAPKDHWLTRDQVHRLIDAARLPHVRLYLILLITTSGRIGALLDLTWDRVDLERRLVFLTNPDDKMRRKGRATVPLNRSAVAALSEARASAISDYVIEWAGQPVKSVKKSIATAAKRVGIRATPHMFRHSAAVWMSERLVDERKIADFLGHGDVEMVRRVYGRFRPDHLRDAAEVLELELVQSYQGALRK